MANLELTFTPADILVEFADLGHSTTQVSDSPLTSSLQRIDETNLLHTSRLNAQHLPGRALPSTHVRPPEPQPDRTSEKAPG